MRSNNSSNLRDENILSLFSLNNFIVPEIQREYVWGLNEKIVNGFLDDIYGEADICASCGYAHGMKRINIGFLYSYKPPYVTLDNERYLDEFLIDGQQRMTTVFLLLLYRAVKEGRVDDFLSVTRTDGQAHCHCFCYKVRELTQQFLDRLILHIAESKDNPDCLDGLLSEDKPSWFLTDYESDPTITAMLETLRIIEKKKNDDKRFFDFILQNVQFWHFKTEVTSQGEELYITMNSRGEELSQNEVQKANLLPKQIDDLKKWGKKWEDWQTSFWKNRGDNPDADAGFNAFLSCVIGMNVMNEKSLRREEIKSLNDSLIKLSDLEAYVQALNYVTGSDIIDHVQNQYGDNTWYKGFVKIVWDRLNKKENEGMLWENKDWVLSKNKKEFANESTQQIKVQLFWPWMNYLKSVGIGNEDRDFLVRLIRLYYTRFHAGRRTASTIAKCVDTLHNSYSNSRFRLAANNKTVSQDEDEEQLAQNKYFSEEEISISNSLLNIDEHDVPTYEKAIWDIQDLKYIQDGQDCGGETIRRFLDDQMIIDPNNLLSSLKAFKSNFETVIQFIENRDQEKVLKTILLFYGDDNEVFWKKVSPSYYDNYETSVWKRIIRTKQFRLFYKDFFNSSFTPEAFLEDKYQQFFKAEKHRQFDYQNNNLTQREIVIIHTVCADPGPWTNNNNIAFAESDDSSVRLFQDQKKLWDSGNYASSRGTKQILLKEDWQRILRQRFEQNCGQFSFTNYPLDNTVTQTPLPPASPTVDVEDSPSNASD